MTLSSNDLGDAVERRQPMQLGSIGQSHSLAKLAYDALVDHLIDGGFEAGDRLVEDRLAKALGVSRGPIRQALQQLAVEGWVEIRPRVGAFVAHRDPKAAVDFFLVRHNLEVLAAGQAAANHTPADLAMLRECIHSARTFAADDPQWESRTDEQAREFHRDTSLRFHELIAQASHNETLRDLLTVLRKKTRWYFTPGVLGHSARAWNEHDEILAAIEAGDAERSGSLMDHHMDNILASYLENMH